MSTTIRSCTYASAGALLGVFIAGCDALQSTDAPSSSRADGAAMGTAPAGAFAAALGDADPYARARNLGALLPSLGPEAIPEVKQALDKFRLDLGAVEFELLLRYWASHEPAEATVWTFKRASPVYQVSSARTVIEIWAEADPAAALVAVESAMDESNEEVARVVQLALVRGWFQKDRLELERYIYDLGAGLKRQRSLFGYALALTAADGSEATIRWSESIPEDDPRYKSEVYRQVMVALTWADLAAAERFCDAHCDGRYGRGMRNVITRTRLRNGDYGGDVVEWIARVPEGDERQRANRQHSLWVAYATWAYHDRASALDWMAQKVVEAEEPEAWVRSLYGEYARQLAADSPEEAIRWGERVEDEVDRERTLVRIARYWRNRDEQAAEAWLSQSPLSEHAREQARDTTQPDNLPVGPVVY